MAYFTYKLLKMKIFKKSNKVQKSPIKSGLIRINPPGLDFLQIIRLFQTLIIAPYHDISSHLPL